MANNNKFKIDISKFVNKSLDEIDKNVRSIVLNLTEDIIIGTPVDTGRLRANWFVSFDEVIADKTDDENWQSNLTKQQANILQKKFNNYIMIQNNLDYVMRIEYDRHSQQAPEGMVRKAIERLKQI